MCSFVGRLHQYYIIINIYYITECWFHWDKTNLLISNLSSLYIQRYSWSVILFEYSQTVLCWINIVTHLVRDWSALLFFCIAYSWSTECMFSLLTYTYSWFFYELIGPHIWRPTWGLVNLNKIWNPANSMDLTKKRGTYVWIERKSSWLGTISRV